jgi:ubiquitin-conjugating enzyme E2 J2
MQNASIIQQKRFSNETKLLEKEPLHYITAYQDKANTLTWYFIIKGQKDSPYYGGEYIGKIVHSPEYPAKPPKYYMLTPNGRFTVNAELCLSNSAHHPESWSSSWNIKSILIAFNSVFLDDKDNGAGFIFPCPPSYERVKLAKESGTYNAKHHSEIYSGFNLKHLKC